VLCLGRALACPYCGALRAGTSLFLGPRPVATPVSLHGPLVCGSSENTRSLKTEEEVSKRQITTAPKQVSSWLFHFKNDNSPRVGILMAGSGWHCVIRFGQ
jgi:hypothetical protein